MHLSIYFVSDTQCALSNVVSLAEETLSEYVHLTIPLGTCHKFIEDHHVSSILEIKTAQQLHISQQQTVRTGHPNTMNPNFWRAARGRGRSWLWLGLGGCGWTGGLVVPKVSLSKADCVSDLTYHFWEGVQIQEQKKNSLYWAHTSARFQIGSCPSRDYEGLYQSLEGSSEAWGPRHDRRHF